VITPRSLTAPPRSHYPLLTGATLQSDQVSQARPKFPISHHLERQDMASRTTISLVDDLDGSEAAETVMFGLGGQLYELDLTTEHAAILRGIFGPYIGAARKVAASTLRSTRTERGGWPSTRGRACRSSRMGRRERNSGFPPWPRTPRRSGALQGRPEHTGSRSCSGREGKQAQAENGLVRWASAESSICLGVGDRARAAATSGAPAAGCPHL